jgi:glycosyltransferase involved in cell wall biosynthesis
VNAREEVAVSAPPCDVLFLLSSLAVGGSERKIARMANRLREEGVAVNLACLNAPYTLEPTLRRDVPLHEARATRQIFAAARLAPAQAHPARPAATVVAVNLYQALYVACATLLMPTAPRIVALVNTSTFRGDACASGSTRRCCRASTSSCTARERRAILGWPATATRHRDVEGHLQRRRFRALRSRSWHSKRRSGCARRSASSRSAADRQCRPAAPEKNHEVLLTTLRRLRVARVDAHLVIAGNGPLRDQLLRRAAELEIADRVNLVGEFEDVRPVLAAIDVFVLPSVAVESFSNAALEAMSMGRP